jgi:Zn-dependent protease with chaperone function
MIVPYAPRLVILSLALFCVIHVVLNGAVALLAPWIIRQLKRARPAPNLLFCLRLLPTGLALFAVAALCVPSYLKLEPEATLERVGWVSFLAAALCASMWCVSITRTWRAVRRSSAWVRHCERAGFTTTLPGADVPVLVVENLSLILVLAGILRPRLIVSPEVLDALSPAQLHAVLRHERGHRIAHDNLKRLLIALAPAGSALLHRPLLERTLLERTWEKHIEWAADDTTGERFHLAEALIRVARMGTIPTGPRMVSSLIAEERDLAARVERLLEAPTREMQASRWTRRLIRIAATATLLTAGTIVYAELPVVHEALEYLIR